MKIYVIVSFDVHRDDAAGLADMWTLGGVGSKAYLDLKEARKACVQANIVFVLWALPGRTLSEYPPEDGWPNYNAKKLAGVAGILRSAGLLKDFQDGGETDMPLSWEWLREEFAFPDDLTPEQAGAVARAFPWLEFARLRVLELVGPEVSELWKRCRAAEVELARMKGDVCGRRARVSDA
jgi:hypothetical protein